jgi:hypothetical protein
LHLSQIFLTLGRTFIAISFSETPPGDFGGMSTISALLEADL